MEKYAQFNLNNICRIYFKNYNLQLRIVTEFQTQMNGDYQPTCLKENSSILHQMKKLAHT